MDRRIAQSILQVLLSSVLYLGCSLDTSPSRSERPEAAKDASSVRSVILRPSNARDPSDGSDDPGDSDPVDPSEPGNPSEPRDGSEPFNPWDIPDAAERSDASRPADSPHGADGGAAGANAPDGPPTIRVASVQLLNVNHDTEGNLQKVARFVEQAADEGADLVLLPEFFAAGYLYTSDIWLAGELFDGPTVTFMQETSEQHGVWLGGSILEADRSHFYNTFVLTDRKGVVAGAVRKQVSAGVEAYFVKEYETPHMIETEELGTIGVGICYENFLCSLAEELLEGEVDLMLMPYSYPSMNVYDIYDDETLRVAGEQIIDEAGLDPSLWDTDEMMEVLFDRVGQELTTAHQNQGMRMARLLGVPAVTSNKTGPFQTELPPALGSRTAAGIFTGQSGIFDAAGEVLKQLGTDGEGLIVAVVALDPELKRSTPPECFQGPASRHAFNAIMFEDLELLRATFYLDVFSAVENTGSLYYTFDTEREEMACAISGQCPISGP